MKTLAKLLCAGGILISLALGSRCNPKALKNSEDNFSRMRRYSCVKDDQGLKAFEIECSGIKVSYLRNTDGTYKLTSYDSYGNTSARTVPKSVGENIIERLKRDDVRKGFD